MKQFLTPHRVLAFFILLNISFCLILAFIVFPLIGHKLDASYNYPFDEYNILAENILKGNGFASFHGEESVVRGPGYPLFLASVYKIAGLDNWTVVQILQSLASGMMVFLSFVLAKRILKDDWKAVISAAFVSIHPLLVWYTFRISVDTLFSFVCLLTFIMMDKLIERPSYGKAIGVGLLIALSAYFKSVTLIFPIVFFIVLLVRKFKPLAALKWAGIAMLVTALAIMPWTIRNYMVTNKFVPVHATLAPPLLWGHYEVLSWAESPLSIEPGLRKGYYAFAKTVEEQGLGTAHYPPHSLEEELKIEKATIQFIKNLYINEPMTFVRNTAMRFVMFWYCRYSVFASLLMIFVGSFTLIFGAIGVKRLIRNKGTYMPLIFITVWVLLHSMLIGEARYQHTILPFLAIFASTGFLHLYTKIFGKNKKTEDQSSDPVNEET